jgi:nucleoside 2-deoxyribosyltransferase
MKVAYFAYPYSDNPEKRRVEAIERASYILKHYGIISIIPHVAIDVYYEQDLKSEITILRAEHSIIERCDMLIVGGELSNGVKWEIAYALELGKPIFWFDAETGELKEFGRSVCY